MLYWNELPKDYRMLSAQFYPDRLPITADASSRDVHTFAFQTFVLAKQVLLRGVDVYGLWWRRSSFLWMKLHAVIILLRLSVPEDLFVHVYKFCS